MQRLEVFGSAVSEHDFDPRESDVDFIVEAVGRLAKIDPTTAGKIGEYQQIISFRNVLIHGYDLVDEAQVWNVIQ